MSPEGLRTSWWKMFAFCIFSFPLFSYYRAFRKKQKRPHDASIGQVKSQTEPSISACEVPLRRSHATRGKKEIRIEIRNPFPDCKQAPAVKAKRVRQLANKIWLKKWPAFTSRQDFHNSSNGIPPSWYSSLARSVEDCCWQLLAYSLLLLFLHYMRMCELYQRVFSFLLLFLHSSYQRNLLHKMHLNSLNC